MKLKFIAILTVILLLVAMYVPVYADTPIPDPPPGAFHYWVVVLKGVNDIKLVTSNNPITVQANGKQLYIRNCRKYKFVDNNWNYDWESLSVCSVPFEHMYSANHDIAYLNSSEFFFTLPKVSELYLIAKEADFGKIWTIILDGLIPLVGLLILAISFRKGWVFLRSQLTH